MKLTRPFYFVAAAVLACMLFCGPLYANETEMPVLTETDITPLTQTDIDIFCQYCELVNKRFKSPDDITREKLVRLWQEAGWNPNRAGIAVSRISTFYDALVENEENAVMIIEYMTPTEDEKDLVMDNQESLAHALSLLEKFELQY